ncbi:MAG: hypothetical protein OXI86_14880, partial [Candidatus Poribacteria bacterium]|nr:hypothetical protein [Candidatus Poribacteria bacterium]
GGLIGNCLNHGLNGLKDLGISIALVIHSLDRIESLHRVSREVGTGRSVLQKRHRNQVFPTWKREIGRFQPNLPII